MSVHKELPPDTEPTQGDSFDREGLDPSPPSSWPALSEGAVPLLDDLERAEDDEREARWRVITGGRYSPTSR
jgi:hypothetical protein